MKLNDFFELGYFVSAWNGKEKAGELFWLFYLIGMIGVSLFSGMLGFILAKIIGFELGWFIPFLFIVGCIIWILKALWACAFNVKWRGWGYIIRTIVLLHALSIINDIYLCLYFKFLTS